MNFYSLYFGVEKLYGFNLIGFVIFFSKKREAHSNKEQNQVHKKGTKSLKEGLDLLIACSLHSIFLVAID